jgi:DNA-binding Lrp family transcriptional regulator
MGEDRSPPERRLTVSDAAQELGISAEAVRSRVKRGSLESVKEGRTVYVFLPRRPVDDQTTTGHDRTDDQTPPERDQTDTRSGPEELVESLLDQVAYMREQLAQEREANRENRRLLAAALERIPAIEAPQEATGDPETASEEPYSTHAPPEGQGQQHPVERPSWWRKFFGLE